MGDRKPLRMVDLRDWQKKMKAGQIKFDDEAERLFRAVSKVLGEGWDIHAKNNP